MTFAEGVTHDLGSPVLCLTLDHARSMILAGTADGHAVALHLSALSSFPLADSPPASVLHRWRPHAGARTRCIAVSPMRPPGDAEEEEDCYVVTGGSDGNDKECEDILYIIENLSIKTFQEYHDFYLNIDVYGLADAFENFTKTTLKCHKLEPCNYVRHNYVYILVEH